MVKLQIKKLYDGVWKIFGFQWDEAVADRDHFRATIERRLGTEVSSQIQSHVHATMGRIKVEIVNPSIMVKREYYELLALELALQEIEHRIEANAVFYDPDHGLLPTLGLSWRCDVLRLLDGQESPGSMPVENVEKFLGMVRDAKQRIKVDSAEETAGYYRKRQRELVGFWKKP